VPLDYHSIRTSQVKQRWSVIGWVTKNLLSRAPPCFGRHVKPLVPAAFAIVSNQPALGLRVGSWPDLLMCNREGLCPSSGDINKADDETNLWAIIYQPLNVPTAGAQAFLWIYQAISSSQSVSSVGAYHSVAFTSMNRRHDYCKDWLVCWQLLYLFIECFDFDILFKE
jgi:hypothetical protein